MGSRMMGLWDFGVLSAHRQIPHSQSKRRILTTGLDCSDHICSCLFQPNGAYQVAKLFSLFHFILCMQ